MTCPEVFTDELTRVLIVDDDPLSRELIENQLEGPEYHTTMAVDGVEGWQLLEQQPDGFDVVLLDRNMPRMDGMELLGRIKRHPQLSHLPVIMETAAADRQDILDGINAGAFYYLTKPLEYDMLITQVAAAASDYRRFRELQLDVQKRVGLLGLLRSCQFEFRTPEQANELGSYLANAFPDPERVVMGLCELMINAIEHGNLEISYDEKTELNRVRRWYEEINRRLATSHYGERVAILTVNRGPDQITISIEDQGSGFDPRPFLQIDPSRVFDNHGRGIAIANLLSFDQLEYRQGGREVIASVSRTDR